MFTRSTLAQLRAAAVPYAETRWPSNHAMLEWFVNIGCAYGIRLDPPELRWIADQIERIEAARGGDDG